MTYIWFIIKSAFADFMRNKVRTFLTSLGILIGVSSVVLLIAFGLGLKQFLKDQFASLGSNIIVVLPGRVFSGGIRPSSGFSTVQFSERELTDLKRIREATIVTGAFTKSVKLASANESDIQDMLAVFPEFFVMRQFQIDKGRLFDRSDTDKRTKVAVLGPKLADKLYGGNNRAIGKQIKIENQGFTVIGVLKSKSIGFGGPDLDSYVYVPYKSAYSFNPNKVIIGIWIQAADETVIPTIKARAKEIMLRRFKEEEFTIIEQTEILNTITSIFSTLNMILVAIGAISLIVGGVGIMNIMFVTVTERTKEIGVRRAIGATKRDILFQFITEAVVLSFVGGLLGLLLSAAIVAVIREFFPAYIDGNAVIIALSVSSAVGIIFGVFPAKKAADLSPIEAIRYE